ncbi:MAG: rhodanese-like domain-containing protein [Halobacteriota archaeon]
MCKIGIGTISDVLTFSLLLLLLLSSSTAYAELTPPLPGAPAYIDIDVEKAYEMLAANHEQIILLDVSTEGEYSAEYIPGAINIPLSDLENRIDELDKSKTIIVYCKTGGRSRTASETLAQHGFENVYNLLGGINAWKEMFATSIATPMPTQTPTLSPTVTPSPDVSPALTPAASPSPITSPILTPTPEEIPGFEAPLAITMLLILFTLRRKRK